MRLFMCVLLVVAVSASAVSSRVGGTGNPTIWEGKGTYTVVDIPVGGLLTSYGMAIKDSAVNSIWINNWGELTTSEWDMSSGSSTGETWMSDGGVNPDDIAFCEYSSGNQWFAANWDLPDFAVYAEDGTFIHVIEGPAGYTNLFGIAAGHDMLYVGSPNESTLAWGSYTGTETDVSWTGEMVYESVYGLAVWGDYLFVSCGIEATDNVFIHELAADGTPGATPVWSCTFLENTLMEADGGIDYDGEYLWLYPQNDYLYKLDIDFIPGQSLDSDTWAGIKTSF